MRAIADGVLGRCPHCHQGPLFSGFLRVRPQCDVCGADLKAADSGDGPAVFVMLIGGFLIVPPALALQLVNDWSPLTTLIVAFPLAVVVCLGLLRPFKGTLISLQFHTKAEEARHHHTPDPQ